MAVLEIIIGGLLAYGPARLCSDVPPSNAAPWGQKIAIGEDHIQLGYGHDRISQTEFDVGFYIGGVRHGVWLRCKDGANDTRRTVFDKGVETGPREILSGNRIVRTEFLEQGERVATVSAGTAGAGISLALVKADQRNGTTIRWMPGPISEPPNFSRMPLEIGSVVDGWPLGINSKPSGGGRSAVLITPLRQISLPSEFPAGFSFLEKEQSQHGWNLAYKARMSPYYRGVYVAPYAGKVQIADSKQPGAIEIGRAKRLTWDTTAKGASVLDIKPEIDQHLKANFQDALPVLQLPAEACIPRQIRSASTSAKLNPTTVKLLNLYRPRSFYATRQKPLNQFTSAETEILRWSDPRNIRLTNQQLLEGLRSEQNTLDSYFVETWRSVPCRRAMIYAGEVSLRPKVLRPGAASEDEISLLRQLSSGSSSPEEIFFFSEIVPVQGITPADQARYGVTNCLATGTSCDRFASLLSDLSNRAWYVAVKQKIITEQPKLIGVPDQMNRNVAIGAGHALASIWVDQFIQEHRKELMGDSESRVAFVRQMQSLVLTNSIWASRFQVYLLKPWSIKEWEVPNQYYESWLRSVLDISSSAPTLRLPSTDEQHNAFTVHLNAWYAKQERISRALPNLHGADSAAAHHATDLFVKFLQFLEQTASRELSSVVASSLDPTSLRERALLAGLPSETISIDRWFIPHETNVRVGDPIFSYSSDDFYRVEITVPISHPVSNQPQGAPIALALFPSSTSSFAVEICLHPIDGGCRAPGPVEQHLLFSRTVFRALVESNKKSDDGQSTTITSIVDCSTLCRSIVTDGRGAAMQLGSNAPAWLKLYATSHSSAEVTSLTNHLLKSTDQWTAIAWPLPQ